MLSFRKILCPTDFSDPSFRALATADELARRYQAELHVLHVVLPVPLVELPPGAGSVAFDVKQYEADMLKAFRARLDETLAQFVKPDIPIHRYVEIGDPAHEIVQLADKIKPDVIVIATHGRTGLKRFIFGSVAEAVVRRSPCAVLTIPMH
ncbi:MAG: universal stress protein [bacterium]|nr:universal stress protein [bacterium]MBK8127661.1 universal stress protein [bacterium]